MHEISNSAYLLAMGLIWGRLNFFQTARVLDIKERPLTDFFLSILESTKSDMSRTCGIK